MSVRGVLGTSLDDSERAQNLKRRLPGSAQKQLNRPSRKSRVAPLLRRFLGMLLGKFLGFGHVLERFPGLLEVSSGRLRARRPDPQGQPKGLLGGMSAMFSKRLPSTFGGGGSSKLVRSSKIVSRRGGADSKLSRGASRRQ